MRVSFAASTSLWGAVETTDEELKMCRDYTHGYDALFTVEESVLDRYVQSLYNNPLFNVSTHRSYRDDWTFHFLFSEPHLTLDSNAVNYPITIDFDAVELRIHPTSDSTRVESGTLSIWLRCRFESFEDAEAVRIDREALNRDYVNVDVLDAANDNTRSVIASHINDIKDMVLDLISDAGVLEFPLDGIQQALRCDRADIAVREDPSRPDRESLVLALFSESTRTESRGFINNVGFFLDGTSTSSVRLSRHLFLRLFQEELDRSFMRFEMDVPDQLPHRDVEHGIELSESSSGQILIKDLTGGDEDEKINELFKHLHVTVSNQESDESATFLRDEGGSFEVSLNATAGDVLEFYGDCVRYPLDWKKSLLLFYPPISVDLRDEAVLVVARPKVRIQGNKLPPVDITLEVVIPLSFVIDQDTGELGIELQDPNHEIIEFDRKFKLIGVGMGHILGALFGAIAWHLANPLGFILPRLVGQKIDEHEGEIEDTVQGAERSFRSLLEPFDGFSFLLESIETLEGGINMCGQLDFQDDNPNRVPSVDITVDWDFDIDETQRPPFGCNPSGATRYHAEFTATTRNLHVAHDENEAAIPHGYPAFVWNLRPGYGALVASGAECRLDIDTEADLPDYNEHIVEMRVTARDVFGRTASDSNYFNVARLSWDSYFHALTIPSKEELLKYDMENPPDEKIHSDKEHKDSGTSSKGKEAELLARHAIEVAIESAVEAATEVIAGSIEEKRSSR
jgi:hypothetical protein